MSDTITLVDPDDPDLLAGNHGRSLDDDLGPKLPPGVLLSDDEESLR